MNTLVDFDSMQAGEKLEMAEEKIKIGSSVIVVHRRSELFGVLGAMVRGERRQPDRHGRLYTSAYLVCGSHGGLDWIPADGVRLSALPEAALRTSITLTPEDIEA